MKHRHSRVWFACFFWLALAGGVGAAPLTPKEFARVPLIRDMEISPDGQNLAWIGKAKGKITLYILNLETNKVHWLAPAGLSGSDSGKRGIIGFSWVSNRRIAFEEGAHGAFGSDQQRLYPLGVGAVDIDGKNWTGLMGDALSPEEREARHQVYQPRGYLGHVDEQQPESVYILNTNKGGEQGSKSTDPLVFRVNTRTGDYKVIADTPKVVSDWVIDHQDRLRMAITKDGTGWVTRYQAPGSQTWRVLTDLSSPGKRYYPLGFAYNGHEVFVAALTKAGTWGVFRYDLDQGALGELVVENADYDIVNPHENPPGVGLLFSRGQHRLIGVRFMADWLQTVWFDPEFAAVQVAVDKALPHTNNLLTDWSRDGKKIVVLACSPQDPGNLYLFDLTSHNFRSLGAVAPWIKPAEMAPVDPIVFHARDGLKLHGYLTYPPGGARQHLPLVVLPHGGPFIRDTMAYDPVLQFLASRGYAVLQVNYRGSPGYGEKFYLAGWHEAGKKIQDDITDGVQAMIAGGVADPRRIAIVGISFGGYSALWALEHTPQLYRCGISIAGVTDFYSLIGAQNDAVRLGSHDRVSWQTYDFWKQKIGDPEQNPEALKAISPLYAVEKIRVPVMIVQGTQDFTVPEDQARRFISALEEHNIAHEAWLVPDEGHPAFAPRHMAELYERMGAFLKQNMQ